MAQTVGTSDVTSKDSILGFLASLKSDANMGKGGDSLFASLLAETKPTVVEIKMPERSVVIERPSLQQTASSATTQKTSASETKAQSSSAPVQKTEEPAQEACQADEGSSSNEDVALKDQKEQTQEAREKGRSSQDEAEAKNCADVDDDGVLAQASADSQDKNEPIEEGADSDEALLAFLTSLNPLAETKETTKGDAAKADTDAQENIDDLAGHIESEIKSLLKTKSKENQASEKGEEETDNAQVSLDKTLAINVKQGIKKDDTQAETGDEAGVETGKSFETVLEKTNSVAQDGSGYAWDGEESSEEGLFVSESVTTKKTAVKETSGSLVADVSGTNLKKAIEGLTSSANNDTRSNAVSETGQTGAAQGLQSASRYTQTSQLSTVRTAGTSQASATSPAEQISVQITKMAKEGQEEMTIQLKPEELGKVQVKLEFVGDHKVQATVSADSQSSLDLLMKDQDSLQRALESAGFSLDSGGMQFSLNEDNQGQSFNEQQMAGRNSFSSDFANDDHGAEEALAKETYYVTPERVNLHV